MEREVSPAESTSTLSTIDVRLDDVDARSSIGLPSSLTPPTSFGDSASEADAAKGHRQSSRGRPRVTSYKDKVLAATAAHAPKPARKQSHVNSRSVSGATLVDEDVIDTPNKKNTVKLRKSASSISKSITGSKSRRATGGPRKSARGARLEAAASNVLDAVVSTTSALGKRSRRVFEGTKESIQEAVNDRRKSLRVEKPEQTEDTPNDSSAMSSRLFPNLKVDSESTKEKNLPKPVPMRRKKFVTCGLYSGQHWAFDARLTESKNRKKIQQKTADNPEPENVFVREASHPMFYMERLLEMGRDYRLPYSILKPLPNDQSPKDWHRLNKNRFIGDASATWKKGHRNLPPSLCFCKPETGCDDDCLNRMMQYECNDWNCKLGQQCGNRAFAELAWRSRGKNFSRMPPRPADMSDKEYDALRKEMGLGAEPNLWHDGVEVMKTKDRGFGVRAMRSFAPGQVVVEYCGEIVTPEEADRRMNNEYKDKTDFYLMTFHDGLIIDATRGSICRFVNHSCEPNCRVEKWTVDGEPRMALFAGENGIMVGEELTYDYNFDPFSKKNIQTCLCGSANCRGVLGPKPTKESSKAAKSAAAAASNLVKGVKRKLKEVFGDDESHTDDEDHAPKRKRILPDPKALLKKATKQLTNLANATTSLSTAEHETQTQSRADRAERRSLSTTITVKSQAEIKLSKKHSRTSVKVTSIAKAHRQSKSEDLSLTRSKSVSPKKVLRDVVNKIEDSSSQALQPATTKSNLESLEDRDSQSGSTTQLLPKKALKQSKLSFGSGNLGFEDPDEMEIDELEETELEDELEDAKTKSKKGGRSFASVRSSAVRSMKGPQRAAAMMKMGLKGNEAVRKTIRQVSGAEME